MKQKRVLIFHTPSGGHGLAALLKAHVDQFTRTDGTVVSAHETSATAAMQKPEHKAVVAAASRGEIDLQHAAEKHALEHDMAPLGQHAKAATDLFNAMGKGPVAAASRGEIDMQHHAEKVALGKVGGAPGAAPTPAPAQNPTAGGSKPGKPAAKPEVVTHDSLKQHPMYSVADHNYLKGKGNSPSDIKEIWDRDSKAGHGPQLGNKHAKPGEPGYLRA